jgi:anti-sigma regulatory factor (Ser/Thr protein kinase)
MTGLIELAPEPRSVREARLYVVDELQAIGRDDLSDAAELGVSELVTNAILHARPPIVVRVGGTQTHPRVEVHDSSSAPPRLRSMTAEERLLATVGRGLGIVAMYSSTWGADVSADGKIVWFEPVADPELDLDNDLAGDVFSLDDVVDERLAGQGPPEEQLTVRLLGMPVRVFAHHRMWYDEVRRELRLLALTHGDEYPIAKEFSDVTLQVEGERRQAGGIDRLDEAIREGREQIDLEYVVPVSAPATMRRLTGVLEQVDVFCREQRLLTLEPTAQLLELRRWYLGEFVRQGAGEDPQPWPGPYHLQDPPR